MAKFDLVVIGAGPGGYVAAIRAAQLGKKVAIVEKEKQLGGTCLRVGCIPSKALLESSHLYENAQVGMKDRGVTFSKVQLDLAAMMKHKSGVVDTLAGGIDGLMKKNKIERLVGHGKLTGKGQVTISSRGEEVQVEADQILLATGSVPASLPGMSIDGEYVGSSTEALKYDEVPKQMVVIGGGVIGLELGTVWRRLGSQVTVLEYMDRILPGLDSEIAKEALKLFKQQGLEFQLGAKVTGVKINRKTVDVLIDGQEPLRCEKVLMAVGRRPNTGSLGLEEAGVEVDQRGFVKVNSRYQTSAPGVFAVGDLIGGAMLAHKAEEEGIACVEQLFSSYGHVNYNAIPSVVYTDPEIASVGKTEDELKESGIEYRKGSFPFMANGRARASGHLEGKVKILADAKTDRVLGVHIIGANAGELIAECVAAIEFGASSEDIARTCHAHPTLSETIKEAALAVDKRTIHM
ncbi:dihydrolipoyl dehydrogenase [Thalassoglobus polymorphus]|uniref:Dihydrolipoyl dehydrogenase n=1 Tax=Thalassoglobus polymorphus TaxID=2527994 RepID=A0A517QSB4_9PLAN|nr:dihydrolipoyl dehydrogenase [Thalassoglobus polymorphus]QDT34501.1 Dihydrolipoyl dehydrogenase [Thalassoglobus polymorphus]